METLVNGETYKVQSQRKGSFTGRLVSHCDTWATLEITDGKAGAMLECNEREKGEEVTVRRSLTSFDKQESA
jgi:hypothetical protein